jgi:hypothetical protein
MKSVRVFVASPGDVRSEREQLRKVIEELNLTIAALAPDRGIVLELVRWETHVPPGVGGDAQDQVNFYITDDYDVFVGIMWKRMGTATPRAGSGTEEEFNRAKKKWEGDKHAPVMFYFCQEPFPPPRNVEEIDQLRKVVEFRTVMSTSGLIAEYGTHSGFSDVVRPHLLLTLAKMYPRSPDGVAREATIAHRVAAADADGTLSIVKSLATQYENIRRTMEPGDARTRQMEIVASKMRSLTLAALPLLPSLINSESAGERLAAISFLEALPQPTHLKWLVDRLAVEKPFAGFHAALALLNAARSLDRQHLNAVREAVSEAKKTLATKNRTGTDRWKILEEAEKEATRMASSEGSLS